MNVYNKGYYIIMATELELREEINQLGVEVCELKKILEKVLLRQEVAHVDIDPDDKVRMMSKRPLPLKEFDKYGREFESDMDGVSKLIDEKYASYIGDSWGEDRSEVKKLKCTRVGVYVHLREEIHWLVTPEYDSV